VLNVIQTELGIGDIICSLYAIEGYRAKFPGHEINFFFPQHHEWANLADIPNLQLKKYDNKQAYENAVYLYNGKEDVSMRIKHTNSPKQYFASKLGVTPKKPAIKASILNEQPVFEGRYIILSPFASRLNRTWEVHNWKILARDLNKAGYRVIVLDSPYEGARCRAIGAEYYWGQKTEWTANVCKNAAMIISNDSGLAHFGGWLGVKTLVIMSQLLPEQFYDFTNNRFAVSQQPCTGCQFLREKGYEEKCDWGCWVLQSVSPVEIMGKALEWLREEELKEQVVAKRQPLSRGLAAVE
jgi:ADP-heptose:LPS heptosyltransferase